MDRRLAMRAAAAAIVALAASSVALAQSSPPAATDRCGDVVTIQTHGRTTTRYALASPTAEKIVVPVLVVGHAANTCIRSPASLMARITARTSGAREQVVTLTGGPAIAVAAPSVSACQGRTPHGFVNREAEVAAGIARFVRGASY